MSKAPILKVWRQATSDVLTEDVFSIWDPGINAVRRNAISNTKFNRFTKILIVDISGYNTVHLNNVRLENNNVITAAMWATMYDVIDISQNSLNYIMKVSGKKIAAIKVRINEINVSMQFDTEAVVLMLSAKLWRRLDCPKT
ncbi:hypothetical protein GJ496_010683 [Pomphorhynchus laevis]|nr:hypothetical protein GJ496_010683 [Pomphorhynchus laevis]